jgi:hypothetical protein
VYEANDFCPECGTRLDSAASACPNCGAAVHGFAAARSSIMARFGRSVLVNKWNWLAGLITVCGLVALMIYTGTFGPSGKAVCTATLNQARDFGVLSPSAKLASDSADSTGVRGRKSCTAKVGEDTYTLDVDVKAEDVEHQRCRDYVKQPGCVALYRVARADGMTTYQVREIPADDTEDALVARGILSSPHPAPVAAPQNPAAQGGLPSDDTVSATEMSAAPGATTEVQTAPPAGGGTQP